MEAEERPNKLRRLNHESDLEGASDSIRAIPAEEEPSKNDLLTANGAVSGSDNNSYDSEGAELVNAGSQGVPVSPAADTGATQPISKNQLKKLRKREEWEAAREYRKAKRKQKEAEKKARKREAREEQVAGSPALFSNGKKPRTRHVRLPVTILIDCGFDDLMVEKEMISLGSQLTRSYSDNHRAPFQAHLVISSWGGLLKQRFDNVLNKHYLNWKGVRFAEEDFAVVAEKARPWMSGKAGGKLAGIFEKYGSPGEVPKQTESEVIEAVTAPTSGTDGQGRTIGVQDLESAADTFTPREPNDKLEDKPQPKGEVVYLTSDSPNTLTELKPFSTYIVGGLVDKNRHKGICYKAALDKGIKTAKLPIGEYMHMQSRFVLATNHVVDIMVRWLECGDWGQAFMQVVPKRKGGSLKEEDNDCYESWSRRRQT